MKDKLNIIVNADDFGANPSINRAIVNSMNSGIVDSTTIMANMNGFEEAIDLAYSNNLTAKIGVHLVLTEGAPLTKEIKSIKYLFNKREYTSRKLIRKCFFLSAHEKQLVFKEYAAQIEKVRRAGISITHLDTHHQIHDNWPIMKIIMDLLKTYKIPHMRILNNLEKSSHFYKNAYRNFCVSYIKKQGLHFTDCLGNQNDFAKCIQKNPRLLVNSTVEVMVHPDYNTEGEIVDKIGGKQLDFSFKKLPLPQLS